MDEPTRVSQQGLRGRVKIVSLIGLVLIWAVLLSVRFLTDPEPQHVPLTFSTGQSRPQQTAGAGKTVKIEPWTTIRRRDFPSPAPKNIFAPLPEPPKDPLAAQAQQSVATTTSKGM